MALGSAIPILAQPKSWLEYKNNGIINPEDNI